MADADTVKMRVSSGARNLLTRFTLRTLVRSAILFGLLVGGIVALQGFGYAEAYTTSHERQIFAQTLTSNPSLGILYGQPINLTEPIGYIAYRCLPILMIAAALWGLATTTKRLRGQEDDGRWELLLTGETTAARAVVDTLAGALAAVVIIAIVAMGIIAAVMSSPDIGGTLWGGTFFALCVLSVVVMFMGVGALTSQLAGTRRRAMLYGVGVLAVFYVLRSIANVVDGLEWLRNLTPLGWVEHAHPLSSPEPLWLLPVVGLGILCMAVAGAIAARRDLGESIIRERSMARSRFGLLSSVSFFNLRLMWPQTTGWTIGILIMVTIIAAISGLAAETVASSNISGVLGEFSGNTSAGIVIGFLSMASFFGSLLLMVMIAMGLGSTRAEEAKSYLDNLLVRQVSRVKWFLSRTMTLLGGSVITLTLANTVVWAIVRNSDTPVSAHDLIVEGFNLLGPVVFVLGLGAFLYGLKPRLAVLGAYVVIGWSFLVDMLRVVIDLPKWVADSSLFSHVALVPASHPVWSHFIWLAGIGALLLAIGAYAFTRRDLEVE